MVDPLRLTRFFDNPVPLSPQARRSQPSPAFTPGSSFLFSTKHSAPFAKFQEGHKRVVPAEAPYGVPLSQQVDHLTVIPTTENERVIGKFFDPATSEAKVPGPADGFIAVGRPRFRNGHVEQPMVSIEKVPEGPVEGPLLPSRRRALNELEVRASTASKALRDARAAKARMVHLMRSQYPAGVLGMDAPGADQTLAYQAASEKLRAQTANKSMRHTVRLENLANKTQAIKVRGYDVLQDCPGGNEKLFQTKRPLPQGLDTADRIFGAGDPPKDPVARRQNIRNNWTVGRNYDIVTRAEIPAVTPTIPEKVNHRLAHPSMASTGFVLNR